MKKEIRFYVSVKLIDEADPYATLRQILHNVSDDLRMSSLDPHLLHRVLTRDGGTLSIEGKAVGMWELVPELEGEKP